MKTKLMLYLLFLALFVYAGSALAFTESTEFTDNDYFGYEAGSASGNYNAFFGAYAGDYNTGSSNTFLGFRAGEGLNNSGSENTFTGSLAGANNTIAGYNTFTGSGAGYSNTSGSQNTFTGRKAGVNNTTGTFNTFTGQRAGIYNTTGWYNTFIGSDAGRSNTTAYGNTFIGYNAGYSNTTGNNNTFMGRHSGETNSEGSGNIFIGYYAGFNETGSNKLYIDNSSTSSPLIYGDFSTDIAAINGNLGIGTTTPGYELDVAGTINASTAIKVNGADITSGQINNWDTAYGWGNHASAGYDTSNDAWTGTGDVYMTSGKVGIGTIIPSRKLTVTGGGIVAFDDIGEGMRFTTDAFSVANSNEDPMMSIGESPSDYIEFSNAGSAVMKIVGGKVGIGTMIPSETLTVAGTIESTSGGIKFPDSSTLTSANTIDADTVDGLDSSAFMTTGTDNWVNTTGDTMTGDLIVEGSVEIDFDLFVNGNTYVDSDKNLKKNIKIIESSLEKIKSLRGVSFAWKNSVKGERTRTKGRHYGVIAQDVEEVLPEIVKTGQNDTKKVAYMELIPVLIEAVKEQHGVVQQQQMTITELLKELKEVKQELKLINGVAMADIH